MSEGRTWRVLARHPWTTSLVMVGVVVTAAVVVLVREDAERDAFAACVARWGDATAASSSALRSARRDVDAANDQLWRAMAELLATPRADAREVFGRVLADYIRESDEYRDSLAANPAPAPPGLACG